MTTELVTFKMEDTLLKDVDKTSKAAGFHNRTEFIRAALRDKIEEVKLKHAMIEIGKIRGKSPRKTTDEELEKIREKAFNELDRKFK